MDFGRQVTQMRAEQALDFFLAPAAVIERRAEEVRAAQQAPDIGAFGFSAIEQGPQFFRGAVAEPFVGIEQQYPGLRGAGDRRVLLRRETEPFLLLDARAGSVGDGSGGIVGTGIEHDHLDAHRGQAGDAAADAVGFVLGDHHARYRQLLHGSVHQRSGRRATSRARRSYSVAASSSGR